MMLPGTEAENGLHKVMRVNAPVAIDDNTAKRAAADEPYYRELFQMYKDGKGKFQDYNGITYLCDWELDSAVNILEVYDLDGKLIPRSKAPFLYELERLKYTRIFAM